MALALIDDAEQRGQLRPGMTVVEITGGSSGPALALHARQEAIPFDWSHQPSFSPERLAMMKALGADLEILPSLPSEGVKPEDIADMTTRLAVLSAQPGYFATDQMHNFAMVEGNRTTLDQEIPVRQGIASLPSVRASEPGEH